MLREIVPVRQIAGEPRRRWFEDDYFDHEKIANRFRQEYTRLEAKISKFVYEKILQIPICRTEAAV